jgi:predicted metal-dependent phosphoesterase TrpH
MITPAGPGLARLGSVARPQLATLVLANQRCRGAHAPGGGRVKLDAHVHSVYSGHSSIKPLTKVVRESYNSVERVYRCARDRGMDLVAITDHDTIDGALTIAERPDVIVGCEVTGVFPGDGVRVHLGVLGITEVQFREIRQLRENVAELLPYLKQQRIFTSLNHVASRINGRITAAHIAALLPWIDGLEIRNGSRLSSQNRTATALAAAYRKVGVGGSDSHTARGIGRTWVEVPGAQDREQFLEGLKAGRCRVGGREGNYFTMASDICRIASGFYVDRMRLLVSSPADWRRHAVMAGGLLALPLIAVPLAVALGHFVLEDRFNRNLLFDLVARPSFRLPEAA